MATQSIQDSLREVITAFATPFNDALEVDHAALADNSEAIYDQGVRTFFACSNVSEYHSLSHEERIDVTETSVNAVPDDATLIAGVGGSKKTAVDLATSFEHIGVDVILMMPPHHTYKHERGLLKYYQQIGDAIETPLVPYLRGFDPSVEFISKLTYLDSVIGLKWALEDITKFSAAVAAGADDVVWINGLGELYALALYVEGAEGMASGIGNFNPIVGQALFDALQCDNMTHARKIRDAAAPYMRFRQRSGEGNAIPTANSIPATKAGLEFVGLTGGPVREPLVDLSENDYERARELYRDLANFIDEEL